MSVPSLLFDSCKMLLPDFSKVDGTKWSVIACDQFTSEPEYWKEVSELVGDAPSTLPLILPEVYLSDRKSLIPKINAAMQKALDEVLRPVDGVMIALERVQSDGKIRRGLVGVIDLETYDFAKGSSSLIRATEETVTERIPPRVEIRENAPMELSHVLLLIDDPGKTVIEPIFAKAKARKPLYDFPLMLGGGHVRGTLLTKEEQTALQKALASLASMDRQKKVYGKELRSPLLFAIGDGNHSLAAAKASYEKLKETLGPAAKDHPARYALCEVENLHDDALSFEPIYRIVFDCEPKRLLAEFRDYLSSLSGNAPAQQFEALWAHERFKLSCKHPISRLPVATLQTFLDNYCKTHPEAKLDYIHGEDSLVALTKKENAIGFLFDGMKKEELFQVVSCDGPLPRKTFSMGHARDKRYYLECRRIK